MIKEYNTIKQIETSLKVISSEFLNKMWYNVKDMYEESHWVSAFNFKLNQFFEDPYTVSK